MNSNMNATLGGRQSEWSGGGWAWSGEDASREPGKRGTPLRAST